MEVQAKGEIPIDLLIDIFSRVPAKTIARCRCVSKLWRSILCRPDFKNLFLTMSSTHRRMFLFTIETDLNIHFFSSPVPENPDENTCVVVPATHYHVQEKQSSPRDFIRVISSLHGFVTLRRGNTMFVYNPVTGESVSLPEVEVEFQDYGYVPILGYDPIDKQLHVLCDLNNSHKQVLTL